MNRAQTKPLEYTTDALGNTVVPGLKVIYYSGERAALTTGTVERIFDRSWKATWGSGEHHETRVVVQPDDHKTKPSNVGSKLLLVYP